MTDILWAGFSMGHSWVEWIRPSSGETNRNMLGYKPGGMADSFLCFALLTIHFSSQTFYHILSISTLSSSHMYFAKAIFWHTSRFVVFPFPGHCLPNTFPHVCLLVLSSLCFFTSRCCSPRGKKYALNLEFMKVILIY